MSRSLQSTSTNKSAALRAAPLIFFDTWCGLLHQLDHLAGLVLALGAVLADRAHGDIIATGTPDGIGGKQNPPVWMKAGDVLEIEISNIGTLRNKIADEK